MHIEMRQLPPLTLFNDFTINVDDCFLVYFMDKVYVSNYISSYSSQSLGKIFEINNEIRYLN